MQDWADDLGSTYVIPEGGSNALGAWGYVSAMEEIESQGSFDHIFHATGSGGTAAGLLAGRAVLNSDVEIHTINVCDDETYFRDQIFGILDQFEENYQIKISREKFHIHDGFVGDGYGEASEKLLLQIKSLCANKGILLDPVYTGKAYFGMQEVVKRENITGKVLFLHTGGAFANFAYSENYSF